MNSNDTLKSIPLTTVTTAFLAGFATGSGLSGAAVTGLGLLTKNEAVRRVAIVAWPLVRSQIGSTVKGSAKSFASDVFSNVASRFYGSPQSPS